MRVHTAPLVAAVLVLSGGWSGVGVAGTTAVVTLHLDPQPGVERALVDRWEAVLAAVGARGEPISAPLPTARLESAPAPRLILAFDRAQDAWAWRARIARHGEPRLIVDADPPEMAAVGPTVPATVEIRLAPAVALVARREALSAARVRLTSTLTALEGVDTVGVTEGTAPDSAVATLAGRAVADLAALRAAIEARLPVRPGGRLRLHALAPPEQRRRAVEDGLAALSVAGASATQRVQVTDGSAEASELVGADAALARAVAAAPRAEPDERLFVARTAPGPLRQSLFLLLEPAVADLTGGVVDARVELTSEFQPSVRVVLDDAAVRRLEGAARRGTAPRIAVVLGDEVIETLGERDPVAHGALVLRPSERRPGATADEEADALARAIRDAPWSASLRVETVTAVP